MQVFDLFNTDYERRLSEGAVDQLEQRRIDDLHMKMDDLVKRAKETKDPAHKAALVKEFQKCKAERDSYYKVKEAGIPGNLPPEQVPGKEDLLKGKGRQTYEEEELDEDGLDAITLGGQGAMAGQVIAGAPGAAIGGALGALAGKDMKHDTKVKEELDESKCNECGMYESKCKCSESVEESLAAIRNLAGIQEAAKPDFADIDKDGDKEESMKKAAADKKDAEDKKVEESIFKMTNLWRAYKG